MVGRDVGIDCCECTVGAAVTFFCDHELELNPPSISNWFELICGSFVSFLPTAVSVLNDVTVAEHLPIVDHAFSQRSSAFLFSSDMAGSNSA